MRPAKARVIDYFESRVGVLFVVGQNLKAGRLWHRADAFTRVFIFLS